MALVIRQPVFNWLLPCGAILLLVAILLGLLPEIPSPFTTWSTLAFRRLSFWAVGVLVLGHYLFSRPSPRQLVVVVGAGALGGMGLGVPEGAQVAWPLSINAAAGGYMFFSALAAGFCMVGRLISASRSGSLDQRAVQLTQLLGGCVFALLYMLFSGSFLGATVVLHPLTFDARMFRLDGTFGFQASVLLAQFAKDNPFWESVLKIAYTYMYAVFVLAFGCQVREGWRNRGWHVVEVWFVVSVCGLTAYHFFPVCGPMYAFGDRFPGAMPASDMITLAPTLVQPSMRNGVPSLHFGWSFAVWLLALGMQSRFLKWGCGLLAMLMIFATLALGEHYLLDLVVAVPFVVGVMGLTVRGIPWAAPARVRLLAVAWGAYVLWMLVLLWGYRLALSVDGLIPGLSIATLGASAWVMRGLMAAVSDGAVDGQPIASVAETGRAVPSALRLASLFFLSGFAALIYEVLFSKQLAAVFGSSSLATYTVLATYMGGMAIGAWLGGYVAQRGRKLLDRYVQCEVGIAVYCALTPMLFAAVLTLYGQLAANAPVDAPWVVALRFGLGALVLMVPTVLMGMTLPILVARLEEGASGFARSVSVLYGANTLGAALGAILAGYLIIPALGLRDTTLLAALINLLVALLALRLRDAELRSGSGRGAAEAAPAPIPAGERGVVPLWALLLCVGAMGVICLGLETLYIHLLAVVAGNSTYAFSLMLFAFLLGLGGGATAIRHFRPAMESPVRTMCFLFLLLAACMSAGAWQWAAMADYFAAFAGYPFPFGFAGRELVRGAVCMLLLCPPALLIGAFFPLSMDAVSRFGGVRALGMGAAVNTAGNIVGVFVGGYLLLPVLGGLGGIRLFAALAVLMAFGLMVQARLLRDKALAGSCLAAVLIVFAAPMELDYSRIASGANVYFQPMAWGTVIDHAESADGGLSSVHVADAGQGRQQKTLTTNGKFQGNDTGEVEAQLGFAVVPLREVAHRDAALVIGYGTGMTANTLRHAGFGKIDVVDLSRDVVKLADRHFSHLNEQVSQAPGVALHIADGRNFLFLQDRQYDLITVELTSIWFAGAGASYNREFYQLAKKRLGSHGVLQQWVQLHHISQRDLLSLIASVRSEFPFVQIFHFGGQGMIVAKLTDEAPIHAASALEDEAGVKALAVRVLGHPLTARPERILDAKGVDMFVSVWGDPADWASTDDNMDLEYGTPKGNVLDGARSYQTNLSILRQYGAVSELSSRSKAK